MTRLTSMLGLILLLAVSATTQAHHSFNALFDVSQIISLTGEVVEFRFIAPHSYIYLRATTEDGAQDIWEVETTTPGMLTRKGVTPVTLQPGQTITVTGNPTRDGRKLIRLLSLGMPDGQVLQIQ